MIPTHPADSYGFTNFRPCTRCKCQRPVTALDTEGPEAGTCTDKVWCVVNRRVDKTPQPAVTGEVGTAAPLVSAGGAPPEGAPQSR